MELHSINKGNANSEINFTAEKMIIKYLGIKKKATTLMTVVSLFHLNHFSFCRGSSGVLIEAWGQRRTLRQSKHDVTYPCQTQNTKY